MNKRILRETAREAERGGGGMQGARVERELELENFILQGLVLRFSQKSV